MQEKKLDTNKIATLTGTAFQDDESFQSEGGFVPERDQIYVELKQGENTFLLGSKDLLLCMKLLERMGEIPEIGNKWWGRVAALYGYDLFVVELEKTK